MARLTDNYSTLKESLCCQTRQDNTFPCNNEQEKKSFTAMEVSLVGDAVMTHSRLSEDKVDADPVGISRILMLNGKLVVHKERVKCKTLRECCRFPYMDRRVDEE